MNTLFDFIPPKVRHDHPATSRESATKIAVSAISLRTKVHDFIMAARYYGATDEEMQDVMVMNPSTQRPRRIELVEMSLVRDSERVRKTKSGRNAIVWVVV